MALPHAEPLDIINVGPYGDALQGQVSTSLIKTQRLQLLHMVLAERQDWPERSVEDECVIHCLEGDMEVVTGSGARRLRPGNVIVVPAGQKHALRARVLSAILVTLLLKNGDAGDHGGAGAQTLQS